ncbi:hypothetical protein K435DRAFT_217791 [Dendrothele bispora CBS 962.96]|uniref:Uncharacterized protein n=1 Tax=Dendrothele bispora (strain CBS 962.96) TaxID=1314807 RepID=A0A4S8LRI0_DENBC|nr:hypothetical protein K435DRAFT_217791 [Dendrothele bispora CBS 962.96]
MSEKRNLDLDIGIKHDWYVHLESQHVAIESLKYACIYPLTTTFALVSPLPESFPHLVTSMSPFTPRSLPDKVLIRTTTCLTPAKPINETSSSLPITNISSFPYYSSTFASIIQASPFLLSHLFIPTTPPPPSCPAFASSILRNNSLLFSFKLRAMFRKHKLPYHSMQLCSRCS